MADVVVPLEPHVGVQEPVETDGNFVDNTAVDDAVVKRRMAVAGRASTFTYSIGLVKSRCKLYLRRISVPSCFRDVSWTPREATLETFRASM